jgi:cytochrome P450 family 97 subfamily B polypeptide 3
MQVASDFAFLPFGGGSRKCVGDQFAVLEAAVALAMLVRRFDFDLAMKPEDVGVTTGATIHTVNGLFCNVHMRELSRELPQNGSAAVPTEALAEGAPAV